mmetsp:Transcript_62823/g.149850  ORF Transcript_62823/g.149850 Transcript_62823/m.149850 type:complete len:252 (+) Transcript_62823:89-844(+)
MQPIESGPGGKDPAAMEDRYEKEWVVPAEITSRRQHKVTKEEVQKEQDEYVTLEWDEVFRKKPKERLRWLFKAFQACRKGKVKPQPLFDIIVHRKFLDGLKGTVATDTLNLIRGEIDVFSNKQQKRLTSDSFELFKKFAPMNVLDSDEDEEDAPALPPPPKVVIEDKPKKRKKGLVTESGTKPEEEEEGNSDDDLDTKRARKLAQGVERRIDPADGQAYTLSEFVQEYGGSLDNPPDAWGLARATAFIFKE